MIEKELIKYIIEQKKNGHSDEDIFNHLKKYNYQEHIIHEAFTQTRKKHVTKPKHLIWILILALVVFGVLFFVFFNKPEEITTPVSISNLSELENEFSPELVKLAEQGISSVKSIEYNDEWVSELQLALEYLERRNMKHNLVTVDGFLGAQSTYALEQFIKEEMLDPLNNETPVTPWMINENLVARLEIRLLEKNISLSFDKLRDAAKNNIKFGYEYTESTEIMELQKALNSLTNNTKIPVNGNYDFVTSTRLLEVKKSYNTQVSETDKINEDESLNTETLSALSRMMPIENITEIEGLA